MKKYFLLLLFIAVQQTYPHKHELKIYRKTSNAALGLCVIGGGISLRMAMMSVRRAYSTRIKPPDIFRITISSLAVLFFSLGFEQQLIWNNKKHKPILIFDDLGFTYEQPQGLFKERKDMRYLWKDVISHWVSGIADEAGNVRREMWHYHIEGIDEVVSIDVSELDIPKEFRTRVESLRQGRIRALPSGLTL